MCFTRAYSLSYGLTFYFLSVVESYIENGEREPVLTLEDLALVLVGLEKHIWKLDCQELVLLMLFIILFT